MCGRGDDDLDLMQTFGKRGNKQFKSNQLKGLNPQMSTDSIEELKANLKGALYIFLALWIF